MAGGEWATRHRPKRFEEVLGQGGPVEALARHVRQHLPRDVFLRGPSGAGKSTLARIYAQALCCFAPTASGSPCGSCPACGAFQENTYEDYVVLDRSEQTLPRIRQLIGEARRPTAGGEGAYTIVLLDETGASDDVYQALLTEVEAEDRAPCVWVFTGVETWRLPDPLVNRLHLIDLAAPSSSHVADRLNAIADREGAIAEPEALEMIAAAAEDFRRAINDLQTLSEGGPVTVDAVKREIVRPRLGWLTDYVAAVARGDTGAQLSALKATPRRPEEIADLILGLLTAVKVRLSGHDLSASFVTSLLTADECFQIARSLEATPAGAASPSPVAFWDGLLAFWSTRPESLTTAKLHALAVRFDDRVQARLRLSLDAIWLRKTPASLPPKVSGRQLPAAPNGARLSRSTLKTPAGHLSAKQVQAIYEAASFALQVTGAPFNTLVRVRWRDRSQADHLLAKRASELVHQLEQRITRTRSRQTTGFHRLTLQERVHGALVTTVVGHVPDTHIEKILAWLDPARLERQAIEIERREIAPVSVSAPRAVDRHWVLTRELWRGADPTVCVTGGPPLIEALGVAPARRRPAGIVTCRRHAVSSGLGPAAQAAEAAAFAPAWSAFADARWSDLFTGWELGERERRMKARSRWAANRGVLEARYGGETALDRAALDAAMSKLAQKQIDERNSWKRPWA